MRPGYRALLRQPVGTTVDDPGQPVGTAVDLNLKIWPKFNSRWYPLSCIIRTATK
jgi:hypothetical protein